MKNYDIYQTIATRSGGDIYFGVVGPVRTGKSTFISKFIEKFVLPNMEEPYERERTLDELPQSSDGKTIMTTEPKFVPSKAVKVNIENVQMKVRLIDCVGYLVEGAIGHIEGNKPRLVKTPWSEEELSFKEAAELGTTKVIEEHSTVGILVTTDGSIAEIDRPNYVYAEEKVVEKLKQSNKPFIILLNSTHPKDESTQILRNSLEIKYQVPVLALDIQKMSMSDINNMLENLIMQFPIVSFDFKMPKWLEALPFDSVFIQKIVTAVKDLISNSFKMSDYKAVKLFENSEYFESIEHADIELSEGRIYFTIIPKQGLFYKVLSEQTGITIENDFQLVSNLKQLTHAKQQYDKIKIALNNVNETGYGVVIPNVDDMILAEPEMIKQNGRYGVKLKATAPSLHMMRVDIETEVSPMIGSEEQSNELVTSLLDEYKQNPQSLWETKIFGKTLYTLVQEGLNHKIYAMPQDAQNKMRKTLSRIVNEGKGGVICILL